MLMISMLDLDKREFHSHAHKMLRECLRVKGIEYGDDTPIVKGKLGKPYLAEYPDVHYNLSHANGIAACMVSDLECGIDCENVRDFRPNVMKRAFSEKEREMVEKAHESEKNLLFFRLWTLKEAYVKALGVGISYPMDTAEFSFDGENIITDIENCRFRQFILKNGSFVVSVCEINNGDN